MKSLKAVLLLAAAVAAMAALVAPAAQAEALQWKSAGVNVKNKAYWTDSGKAISSKATLTLEGTLFVRSDEGLGTLSCPLSATASLQPGDKGEVTGITVPGGCKAGEFFATACGKSGPAEVKGSPWAVTATESGGQPRVTISGIDLAIDLQGGSAECPIIEMSGKTTTTPDNGQAMSSLTGTPELTTNFGPVKSEASLSLAVAPTAKYGVGLSAGSVSLSGDFTLDSEEFGGFECVADAGLDVKAGSEGVVTSFNVHGPCATTGFVRSVCSSMSNIKTTNLPWSAYPEKVGGSYLIRLKGFNVSWEWSGPGCPLGKESASGELLLFPNNSSAITSTQLGGTLSSGLGNMTPYGTLSWTPASVYGIGN